MRTPKKRITPFFLPNLDTVRKEEAKELTLDMARRLVELLRILKQRGSRKLSIHTPEQQPNTTTFRYPYTIATRTVHTPFDTIVLGEHGNATTVEITTNFSSGRVVYSVSINQTEGAVTIYPLSPETFFGGRSQQRSLSMNAVIRRIRGRQPKATAALREVLKVLADSLIYIEGELQNLATQTSEANEWTAQFRLGIEMITAEGLTQNDIDRIRDFTRATIKAAKTRNTETKKK